MVGGGKEAWWSMVVCDEGIIIPLVIIDCCMGRAD